MNQDQLLEIIKNEKLTNIKQLIAMNLCSESTIRRHLKRLCETGLINMAYGGSIEYIEQNKASLADTYKTNLNLQAKQMAAHKCAKLIEDDDIVYIDNGTTVRNILKFITAKNVTVYTNGYHHIDLANQYGIKLILIPGEVLAKEAALIGSESILFLSNYTFDKVFIGANGYSEDNGVSTPNKEEALLKQAALSQGVESYIVIDKTKYGLKSKWKICNYNDHEIIDF